MYRESTLRKNISMLDANIQELKSLIKNKHHYSYSQLRVLKKAKAKAVKQINQLKQKLKTYYANE